ncbi:MAG: ABC transporter permease [Roseimicrobium sp.]
MLRRIAKVSLDDVAFHAVGHYISAKPTLALIPELTLVEDFILALRNIGRNRRRSLVTVLAITLCCGGLILFGGYVSATFRGDETRTVAVMGHMQIFKKGFFEKGVGNPTAYAIDDYEEVKRLIATDPVLAPKLNVVTGTLLFAGIASCYEKDTSASIIGLGMMPDGAAVLHSWNPYHLMRPYAIKANKSLYGSTLDVGEGDLDGGSLSIGLARILEVSMDEAATRAKAPATTSVAPASATPPSPASDAPNFDALATTSRAPVETHRPSIELLAAPHAGGAPNVTTMGVRVVKSRPTKDLEDRLIIMHVKQASELLFPGEPLKVTSVLVQLHRTEDVPIVAARVRELLAKHFPQLECRTWLELSPFYTQLTLMFGMMFIFMGCIIAVIVVFTIYNTLSMAILERINEIGTMRALGLTKTRVRKLFFLEGVLMGVLGGVLGVLLAMGAGAALNAAEIIYMPPTVGFYAKLEVLVLRNPIVMLYGFLTAVGTAMISAILPARQAANMPIVTALRHG